MANLHDQQYVVMQLSGGRRELIIPPRCLCCKAGLGLFIWTCWWDGALRDRKLSQSGIQEFPAKGEGSDPPPAKCICFGEWSVNRVLRSQTLSSAVNPIECFSSRAIFAKIGLNSTNEAYRVEFHVQILANERSRSLSKQSYRCNFLFFEVDCKGLNRALLRLIERDFLPQVRAIFLLSVFLSRTLCVPMPEPMRLMLETATDFSKPE